MTYTLPFQVNYHCIARTYVENILIAISNFDYWDVWLFYLFFPVANGFVLLSLAMQVVPPVKMTFHM